MFDLKAEAVFAYLQVFSAICVMFAHVREKGGGRGEGVTFSAARQDVLTT